jgi:hypothetical protein
VNKKGLIILISGFFFMAGCTTQSTVSPDRIWPETSAMSRLERNVQDACDGLVKNIRPGSVCLSWSDNLHPNAPMLVEGYIASMYEQSLMHRGFSLKEDDELARYRLKLTMTPSKKGTLVMASMTYGEEVIAAKESYLSNGWEPWNSAMNSYRYRTKTKIALGDQP